MSQQNAPGVMAAITERPVYAIVRFIRFTSTLCGITASLMILASVVITCQMIWVRYVMNLSTIWQTEAVTYLMIAATILGLPFVQLHRGHVSVDLLPLILSSQMQRLLRIVTLVLTIAVLLVMLYYGYELFHTALEKNWKSDTVWAVPMWIPYLCMPVGFSIFVLQLFADLYELIVEEENSGEFANDKKEN